MKKPLLLTTALGFSTLLFSQTPGTEQPQHRTSRSAGTIISLKDSSIAYSSWNATTNNWDYASRDIYNYNVHYKEDGDFLSYMTGSGWQNFRNTKNYVFDTNDNLLGLNYEKWVSGAWADDSKDTYTYDALHRMLTKLQQSYLGTTLINSHNTTFTYTGNNRTLSLYQYWNTTTNAWNNMMRTTSTYNTNNELTSDTDQSWTAGAWKNDSRRINFVYTLSYPSSYESESWNSTASAYEPNTKTLLSYDSNHYLLNTSTMKWNPTTASWDNYMKSDYLYDLHGNEISLLTQNWNVTLGAWENMSKVLSYYRTGFVGIQQITGEGNKTTIYPNPARDQLTITYTETDVLKEISISDVSGKLVLTQTSGLSGPVILDVSSLCRGIYIMAISSAHTVTYKKFVKD